MIYDYLFFKSYQLAQKSKNFDDVPVLGGIWGVMSGFIFNFFAIVFLIDGILDSNMSNNEVFGKIFTTGKYIFAIVFLFALLIYYRGGGRWKRIVAKYEAREKERGKSIHPIIPVLIYNLLSVIFIFLAGMYKHKYWVFG